MIDKRSEESSRPKLAWLVAAVLTGGALLSFIVLGYPQLRGQRPLLSEDEAALLGLINDYRFHHDLPALKVSPTLTAAARWMSEDAAKRDHLGLIDSLGRNPLQRMAAFGYTPSDTWGLWGIKQWNEITGAGYETPEIAFEVWRKFSPVMLSDDYVVAGVGKAYNAQSLYGWYWTVDFGSYDDSQPTSLAPSPTQFP